MRVPLGVWGPASMFQSSPRASSREAWSRGILNHRLSLDPHHIRYPPSRSHARVYVHTHLPHHQLHITTIIHTRHSLSVLCFNFNVQFSFSVSEYHGHQASNIPIYRSFLLVSSPHRSACVISIDIDRLSTSAHVCIPLARIAHTLALDLSY